MSEPDTAADVLASRLATLEGASSVIDTVTEGEELVFVLTDDGDAGVAANPGGELPSVNGESAVDVAHRGARSEDPATRAVGVAALNAIDPPASVQNGLDPFRSLADETDHVAMVGLFGPVLRHLEAGTVSVFERDPEAVEVPESTATGLDVMVYPPSAAESVLPEATVVFVTGSTLVYGGLSRYLRASTPSQSVVIVGASASFRPAPLFAAGADVVAGASVRDPDRLASLVAADHAEADLHHVGLEKWAVVSPEVGQLPGLTIDPA
ncbi:MAG: Rossmann-like domain-containing protein [Halodesulfurarchaeum sp.]